MAWRPRFRFASKYDFAWTFENFSRSQQLSRWQICMRDRKKFTRIDSPSSSFSYRYFLLFFLFREERGGKGRKGEEVQIPSSFWQWNFISRIFFFFHLRIEWLLDLIYYIYIFSVVEENSLRDILLSNKTFYFYFSYNFFYSLFSFGLDVLKVSAIIILFNHLNDEVLFSRF